jgi:hypothetical protein
VTDIWRWNGEHYLLFRENPDPPTYRFEAVEDGDRLSGTGLFDEAVASYQRDL